LIQFIVFDENVTAQFGPEWIAQFKSEKGAQYRRNLQREYAQDFTL